LIKLKSLKENYISLTEDFKEKIREVFLARVIVEYYKYKDNMKSKT